jgi:RND superfamily putative drug exporter
MVVVSAAMLGSISVLPALLHKLGDRIEKGRIPLLNRKRASGGESRVWNTILTPVLRRPLVWGTVATAVLVALSIPTFSLETKFPSITELPRSIPIVKTFSRAEKAFPGEAVPAVIVVKSRNVDTLDTQQAILDMRDQAVESGGFALPTDIATNPAKTVTRITLPIAAHNSRSKEAYAALANLRENIIPRTIGAVAGTEVAVTGETAANHDFNALMKTHMPIVFVFVLALAFVLLLVTFRSVVIPVKSIVLNLLSVGASYGILVLVFQHTWAEGALDFTSNGAIVSWLPLFLFVLLFGLSMDYHVFILSRVKELVDGGMKTEEAVERGIRTTAGTVTSAAIVMVAVFSIFATLSSIDMKQMGFGLAVAVLLDATIIRGVLLPATMKVLGDWNWYLPSWLEWIPQLSEKRERAPEAPPVTAPAA